jgi:hypothetical protein
VPNQNNSLFQFQVLLSNGNLENYHGEFGSQIKTRWFKKYQPTAIITKGGRIDLIRRGVTKYGTPVFIGSAFEGGSKITATFSEGKDPSRPSWVGTITASPLEAKPMVLLPTERKLSESKLQNKLFFESEITESRVKT